MCVTGLGFGWSIYSDISLDFSRSAELRSGRRLVLDFGSDRPSASHAHARVPRKRRAPPAGAPPAGAPPAGHDVRATPPADALFCCACFCSRCCCHSNVRSLGCRLFITTACAAISINAFGGCSNCQKLRGRGILVVVLKIQLYA